MKSAGYAFGAKLIGNAPENKGNANKASKAKQKNAKDRGAQPAAGFGK